MDKFNVGRCIDISCTRAHALLLACILVVFFNLILLLLFYFFFFLVCALCAIV